MDRIASSPLVVDFDRDGIVEVITGSDDGHLYIFNGADAGVENKVAVDGKIISSPSGADVDGDGRIEILAGVLGEDYGLFYFDFGGFQTYISGTGGTISSPSIADIDGDGDLEVFIGLEGSSVMMMSLGWIGSQGPVTSDVGRSYAVNTEDRVSSSPAIADLSGDGILDAVVQAENGEIIAIEGLSGEVMWSRKVTDTYDEFSSPVVGDVDGDGEAEVIGSTNNLLFILGGRDGKLRGVYSSEYRIWSSSPVICDVDGDGTVNVIFGNENSVVTLTLQDTVYFSSRIYWPRFKHDEKNSGLYTGSAEAPW